MTPEEREAKAIELYEAATAKYKPKQIPWFFLKPETKQKYYDKIDENKGING